MELVRQYLIGRMDATLENVGLLQPHEKFIQILRNMHSRNEVGFSNSSQALSMPDTFAKSIGYITTTKTIYLDVDNAYDLVVKFSHTLGRPFTYPLIDLKRDLCKNGITVQKSENVKIDGKGKRMFKLLKNVFEDENAKYVTQLD